MSKWQLIISGLVLMGLTAGSTVGIVGCKTRSPLVDNPKTPEACKGLYECLYYTDRESQTACLTEFGKNCNSTMAENDCAKRFKRLPELTEKIIDKMTKEEYRLEQSKRVITEKSIEGCVKLRL